MKFIVKLFPEITIKSKPVRQRLVKQLRQNIRVVLGRDFPDVKIQGFWDKIEVRIDDEHGPFVAELLQRIPGIANVLEVQSYEIEDIGNNFEQVLAYSKAAYQDEIRGKSFVVRVKRVGKHDFASTDLERFIGGGLLQQTEAKCVDLSSPEVTVNLEVRDDQVHLVQARYEGLGGYPIGTQEPVLSLISGGFDSTVSSYLTMKRGLKTHFCFFNLGGSAHEIGVKQVSQYLWQRYGSSHRVKFITVPFEGVIAEILNSVNHTYMGVVLKRMMYRAADRVAREFDVDALVTGESVAQVSSQTLPNLKVIDSVTDRLVLRPLITMDKQDIIRLSAEIGTEDYAKNMPEFCGVISDRPTTKAREDKVLEQEAGFNMEVLEQALAETKVQKIDEVLNSEVSVAEVELVSVPAVDDVVIDIRHIDEREKRPLTLTNNPVKAIAFYELLAHVDELKEEPKVLLYCEQGSMSQLHASHLKGLGLDNIAVYLPA